MKFIKSLALLAVVAVSVASVQETSILRRTLKANTKQTYNVTTETHISADTPAGAQEGSFKSVGKLETSIGSLKGDGATADYTMTTTVDHLDADGVAAMSKMPDKVPPVTVKATIDQLNALANSRIVGDSDAAKAPMSIFGGSEASQIGMFVTYPENPVKVGDTWAVIIPPSAMNKASQSLTAKLIGTKDLDGKSVRVIGLTGKLIVSPDPNAMKQAGGGGAMDMTIHVKGTSDVDSEILVDPATGETVQATSKVKGRIDIEIVELSTTFHATSDTSVKMTKAS